MYKFDLGGLWEIVTDPPVDSGYYKGQIVEITNYYTAGYDYWPTYYDSREWIYEPIVQLNPSYNKFKWTRLSNLKKVYDL